MFVSPLVAVSNPSALKARVARARCSRLPPEERRPAVPRARYVVGAHRGGVALCPPCAEVDGEQTRSHHVLVDVAFLKQSPDRDTRGVDGVRLVRFWKPILR